MTKDKKKKESAPTVPKKRGRKPKGGKILQQLPPKSVETYTKPNIVLHLKCSSNALSETGFFSTIDYCPTIETVSAFNALPEQDESSKTVAAFDKGSLQYSELPGVSDDDSDAETINTYEPDSSKHIWKKLRTLNENLHSNNVSNKDAACFWCTYDFSNPACYIPKTYLNDYVEVYGNFCSPECATASLFEENICNSTKWERYAMLNNIYAETYGYDTNVKPSPRPHYLLSKYCGTLSIKEYRRLFKDDKIIIMADKPLTKVFPELYDDNNEVNAFNRVDMTDSGVYKKASIFV